MNAGSQIPLPQTVLLTLEKVLQGREGAVALHEPRFEGREAEYLMDCLDSTYVSSVGAYVDRFERQLAEIVGVRHAIAAVNGTAALQVALRLAGVERDDEVLVPALTFIGTANAVAYQGAVPHFVDSHPGNLGIDAEALAGHLAELAEPAAGAFRNRRTGRRLAALLPVHIFGHPADMDALSELAARYRLPVIEDAAESLGSSYKGRMTGGLGLLGAMSFNGNKVVTTGGGGAILTDDPELARAAKHLTTTAKLPHSWDFVHDQIGFNYRMPNLNAALGCAQLEQLEGYLAAKRRLADRYAEAFAGVEGAAVVREPGYGRSNYWLNALLLDESQSRQRDAVLSATNDAGLMTRPVWRLMHRLPMFEACPRMNLSTAESLERRLINLPSSPFLGEADVRS